MSFITSLVLALLLQPIMALAENSTPNLPTNLKWQTNLDDPIFASPEAVRGGRFRSFITTFPLTLRLVGPDANGSFAYFLRANALGLVDFHPNTLNPIPMLATHWAFAEDGKTVYYRLDPRARWSDGEPVTADDYLYTLEFMRSEHIVAPWYNNHYSNVIVDVRKFDDHTISITGAVPKPREELLYEYGLRPTPEHFHQLDENWVRNYNWKIEPNTGPYQISKIRKGKYVEFERKADWWGDSNRYLKHRFNPDHVRVKVIRDINMAYQYFAKGELDTFPLNSPRFWHKKAQGDIYEDGLVGKIKFYNDVPQPSSGMYLNEDDPILGDIKVRYAIAHATNVQKVIDTVLRGDYERLNSQYEGYGDYTHPGIRAREFDLVKANQLLDEAGWQERNGQGIRMKNGQQLSLRITYFSSNHSDRLVIIQREALKAGIDFQLQLLDASTGFKQVLEKKHQIAWMGWSGGGLSPVFWEFYHSDNAHKPQNNNITNTNNPEIDRYIGEYRKATEKAERVRLAHKLQELVHVQGSFIPTFKVPYTREGYWRWLKLPPGHATRTSDSVFSVMGSTGGLFWIDTETRQRIEDGDIERAKPSLIIDETWRK
ncbi:microcin C transport system substrate-binding protein [Litorivivens lipolytica]|uniref:Microcin C transport system substrate-binding protein n=1 Tax=Litorivivens lipolytica TaxID=1524264 RepID=A0A7W4Z4F7_9GAMM|nr:microcin C transport system substrate-binding protein [Litorivivens lipolytica]